MVEQIISRIQAIPLQSIPYPYLWAEGVIPKEFYAELIRNIPNISHFSSSERYPRRYALDLASNELNQLSSTQLRFWSEVIRIFQNDDFMNAIIQKFRPDLKGSRPNLQSSLHLIRDQSNYSIGPHTDLPSKVITLLFYLPATENQKHLGTSIYVPKTRGFICKTGAHYPFHGFDKTLTVPFLPNSVFGFARSDVSFHGVESTEEHEMERRLLIYTIWLKKSNAV